MTFRLAIGLAAAVAVLGLGCGDDDAGMPDSGGADAGEHDAGVDDGGACDCTADAECDDGTFCNGAEMCVDCACVTIPVECDDEMECTADSCNEGARECRHV